MQYLPRAHLGPGRERLEHCQDFLTAVPGSGQVRAELLEARAHTQLRRNTHRRSHPPDRSSECNRKAGSRSKLNMRPEHVCGPPSYMSTRPGSFRCSAKRPVQLKQAFHERISESVPGESPGPIAIRPARQIHACGGTESKDVLERRKRHVSHRGDAEPDEIPADFPAVRMRVPTHPGALG